MMAVEECAIIESSTVIDGEISEGSTSPLSMKLVENLNLLESRLEGIEKKYQELLAKQGHSESETKEKKEEKEDKATEDDKGKEKNKDKKDTTESELDENAPLIPSLNRLSWPQWVKLQLSEREWENKSDEQKKKDIKRRKTKPKSFVIDVVADMGDLGLPTNTEKKIPAKYSEIPYRIRINSEHILDVLNETANVVLPQKCQLLHPYKIIVDNLEEIKGYEKTLEEELTNAKTALAFKANDSETEALETKPEPPLKESNGTPPTEKDQTPPSKSKASKSKEEEDVELVQEKIAHYRCFIELLETNLAPEIEVANSIKDGTAEKILFCHLWHLFPPGETIYYQSQNRNEPPQATQVMKVSGGRAKLPNSTKGFRWYRPEDVNALHKVSPFTIDAFHLDFDGKKFRLIQVKHEIPRFTGEIPITSLKVFPIRFFSEQKRTAAMQLLLNRGLNFRSLTTVGVAHREYRGMSLDLEREDIDSRVIIDFKLAPVINQPSQQIDEDDHQNDGMGRTFGLRPLSQTKETEVTEVFGMFEDPDLTLYNDHIYDCDKTDKLFSKHRFLSAPSQEMNSEDLTDEELRLLPGAVYAYILRSRKYCRCDINLIKEITLNKEAFDDLVLPESYKNLIKSLIGQHSMGSRPVEQKTEEERPVINRADSQLISEINSQQDTLSIVKGKGGGLIILLHGVPGVGKTSTAETIAEATGRPLLLVTCGDVGGTAAEVERNLEQIFTNSHRWGCVLLLDEAEVFLAKRNLQDLTRNAMVSVFLRVLEFYSGILFLTTNRVGTIDEAFKSRIHISLYYPPLDWKTSKLIWQVNLKRSQSRVDVDKDEILGFAKKHFFRSDENSRWNGRQIYNAFKTAIALAEFEGQNNGGKEGQKPTLTASHLRQVSRVAKKFDEYLLETQGGETLAAMNQQQQVRADNFGLDDQIQKLKRRPTKNRTLDLDELPSTSEEDSDGSINFSAPSEEETDSDKDKRKSKKKTDSSKKKKSESKKRKSKKRSKNQEDTTSDASS
ncbi:hypothetical protein BGW36DRAFT_404462 [Talaromyces proteolyticus]|uniref:AAA+ ATPase domain-containing protein n=1 Tax=Talaromyces proteolyticus TaxID=1131652 RepID=A0AAD4Q5I5_9EURO|nr:uncharacterized protein BGW36DRAFT_404462 [Talaromyces proteolyticus]KAH8704254.1 hypothetical protein BGW36DRAFT_404462 [Talaromyces proteolyticus]